MATIQQLMFLILADDVLHKLCRNYTSGNTAIFHNLFNRCIIQANYIKLFSIRPTIWRNIHCIPCKWLIGSNKSDSLVMMEKPPQYIYINLPQFLFFCKNSCSSPWLGYKKALLYQSCSSSMRHVVTLLHCPEKRIRPFSGYHGNSTASPSSSC